MNYALVLPLLLIVVRAAEHEHHHHHHHHQNKEEKNALAGFFEIISLSPGCHNDYRIIGQIVLSPNEMNCSIIWGSMLATFQLFSIAQGGNEIDEKANAGAAEVNTAAGVSSKDSVEKVDEAEMNKESGKAEEEHAESEMTESKKSDDPHAEHEHHHHHHHHHQNKEEKNALAGLFDRLSLSRACLYD